MLSFPLFQNSLKIKVKGKYGDIKYFFGNTFSYNKKFINKHDEAKHNYYT